MGRERYYVKMKYKVQDSDEIVDGEILEKLSQDEYKIKIKDNEYVVKILHTDSNVMEFVLNNEFHSVRYVDSQTSEMNFIVDGSSMSVNMNSHLDDIVYKNSGGSDYTSQTIKDYDVLLKDLLHVKDYNAAKRSVFILDEEHKVIWKWVSEDPLKEPDYSEIMNAAAVPTNNTGAAQNNGLSAFAGIIISFEISFKPSPANWSKPSIFPQ